MNYYKIIFGFITLLFSNILVSQNSMVGDGFGGRLWYQPTNYTVGSYSGYSICYTGPCSNGANQLYGWGSNSYGELGIGFGISGTNTPTAIPNMTNVKYYSTGYIMGAIKNDNSGWVWGAMVGATPSQVITNAKFLDASSSTISFVKYDGTVWSVGSNYYGNFGDGNTLTSSSTPIQMLNINNAVRVANNGYVTIVLLADGTLKSVGTNQNGCLGIGNSTFSHQELLPVNVSGLIDIIDIKANALAIAALDISGDVFTWGSGFCIGDGDNSDEYSPKKITTLSNIIAISGCDDGAHFLALDANKNCYAWGVSGGQTGVPFNQPVPTPTLVATNVIDIMAGETFSYLVKADGTLWGSGYSNGGSIWLNLPDQLRDTFTLIYPSLVPGACNVSALLANTTPACSGNNGNIIITNTGGQAPYIYNIGSGNQSNNTFSGLPAGNYTITITDNNNCVTTLTCIVNTGSGSSPIITVNSPTICSGSTAIITANGAANYSWSNASTLSSASGYSVVANPTITTIYAVTGTNNNACAGINSSTVTVVEKPIISATTNSVCIGASVVFNTSSSGTHSWSPSNSLNNAAGTTIIATPTTNTTYTILSISGTCSFTNTQTIIVDNIIPLASFYGVTDTNLPTGTILQLDNQSTNASNYKWEFCDGSVSTNSNVSVPLNSAGNCCIKLIAYNNSCTDTVTQCVNVFSEFEILIPNVFTPNNDGVNDLFKITANGVKTFHCEICNRWGIKLYEWNDVNGSWDGKTKTGSAPAGTYFYILNYTGDSTSETKKGFLSLFRD